MPKTDRTFPFLNAAGSDFNRFAVVGERHNQATDGIAVDLKNPLRAGAVLAVGNKSTESGSNLSYSAGGTPLPKTVDPAETFKMLFSDLVVSTDPQSKADAERKRKRGQSVLDYVRKDIARVQARLAPVEKQKLDQHLGSLRELEKKLDAFSAACTLPGKPDPTKTPKVLQYNGGEPYFDVITDLQIDMLAQAMACDLTRFATFMMSDLSRTNMFTDLPEDVHNGVAHTYDSPTGSNFGSPGQPGKPDTWTRLGVQNKYCIGKIARLMQRLDQVGILDDTLLYFSSDMGDPARHSLRNPPTILAGGVPTLRRAGRCLWHRRCQIHPRLAVRALTQHQIGMTGLWLW